MIDKILEFAVELIRSGEAKEIKKITRDFFGEAVEIRERAGKLEIHVSKEYKKFAGYISKLIEASYERSKVKEITTWPFLREELLLDSLEYKDSTEKSRLLLPFGVLEILFRIFEFKDYETREHITRVGIVSAEIAKTMGEDDLFVSLIRFAAPLHDIGKLLIPNEILLKPGKLTKEEWEIVKKHPIIGWRILKDTTSDVLRLAASIALTHHERWDGTGYPKGLKGGEIPIEGRIVAVADSLDAMVSERPYKKSKSLDDAIKEITELSGVWYDPEVVKALNLIREELRKLYERSKGKKLTGTGEESFIG